MTLESKRKPTSEASLLNGQQHITGKRWESGLSYVVVHKHKMYVAVELFIRFTVRIFHERLSIFVCTYMYFPFRLRVGCVF